MKKFLLSTILLFSSFSAINAQISISGEVIDVLDGKTAVIAATSGKVRVELQYIEVPEPGQQFHETVVEHLRKMLIGKVVDYRARTIYKDRTVGRLLLGNIDVSQQMLRDGAAWHIPAKLTGQEASEVTIYSSNEADARTEKRGIWSVEGMKMASEFRMAQRAATSGSTSTLSKDAPKMRAVAAVKTGPWGDKDPGLGDVGALLTGYNANTRSGFVGTSYQMVDLSEIEKNAGSRTAVDITYFYKNEETKGRDGVYVISVASIAPTVRFLTKNELYVISDGKSTVIGKAKRTTSKVGENTQEVMTYTVTRKAIESVVNGGEVILKVGEYRFVARPAIQYILYNLLQVTKQ